MSHSDDYKKTQNCASIFEDTRGEVDEKQRYVQHNLSTMSSVICWSNKRPLCNVDFQDKRLCKDGHGRMW